MWWSYLPSNIDCLCSVPHPGWLPPICGGEQIGLWKCQKCDAFHFSSWYFSNQLNLNLTSDIILGGQQLSLIFVTLVDISQLIQTSNLVTASGVPLDLFVNVHQVHLTGFFPSLSGRAEWLVSAAEILAELINGVEMKNPRKTMVLMIRICYTPNCLFPFNQSVGSRPQSGTTPISLLPSSKLYSSLWKTIDVPILTMGFSAYFFPLNQSIACLLFIV